MISDLKDERIAILRFALDKLRRCCSIANRNMNGASQRKLNRSYPDSYRDWYDKSKITNRKSEIYLGVYGFDSIDL